MTALRRELTYDAATGALLAPRAQGACGSCRAASHCGSQALASRGVHRLPLPVDASRKPVDGERFLASYPAGLLLRQLAAVFPGLALLITVGAAAGLGLYPAGGDAAALAGAFAALCMGCAALKLYDSRAGSRPPDRRLVIVPKGRGC